MMASPLGLPISIGLSIGKGAWSSRKLARPSRNWPPKKLAGPSSPPDCRGGVNIAYVSDGALRDPNSAGFAPAEVAPLLEKARSGSWQLAHDWPCGSDSVVSLKI